MKPFNYELYNDLTTKPLTKQQDNKKNEYESFSGMSCGTSAFLLKPKSYEETIAELGEEITEI